MGNYYLTKYGLIFLIVGLVLGIITNVSIFLTNGQIQALSFIQLIGMIFFLVAIILMVIGGFGLKEYGAKHGKFTLYALIIFIIALIVGLVFIVMTITSSISSFMGSGNLDSLKYVIYFGPIFTVFVMLIYLFLLYELENLSGKIILFVAFPISIIVSIVIAYLSIPIFDELFASFDFTTMLSTEIQSLSSEASMKSSVIGIFNIIPNLLLLVAMIIPLYRISTGELTIVPRAIKRCTNCGFDVPSNMESCPKCGNRNFQ